MYGYNISMLVRIINKQRMDEAVDAGVFFDAQQR